MQQLPIHTRAFSACGANRCVLIILTMLMLATPAHAEYLGLIPGREATPVRTSDLSVELGFVSGELGQVDYQNIAARVNYRLSTEVVVTGTLGIGEYGETDGVPMGLGISYHLSNQRISDKLELAARASYHSGDYSLRDLDGEISSFVLEALISGAKPLMDNGLAWYSNVGYHLLTVDFGRSDSANEIGIGGGLVLPTGLGEAYVGAEYVDELSLGLGIRYFVQ